MLPMCRDGSTIDVMHTPVCVCVRERERERESVCERERERVCVEVDHASDVPRGEYDRRDAHACQRGSYL